MSGLRRTVQVSVFGILTLVLVLCFGLSTAGDNEMACGDVDCSGIVDISDLVYLVDFLFFQGPAPVDPRVAACDGSSVIDIGDLVWMAEYLAVSGPAPVCPFAANHADSSGPCLSHKKTVPEPSAAGDVRQSPCLDNNPARRLSSDMYAELIDGNLHVYHTNAFYQCCLGYQVTYGQDGRYITATESDTAALCDCMCHFNLESVWNELEPYGNVDWIVILIGIEGDTVGVDTIPLNGTMYVEVDGNDLRLHHQNARLNCCPAYYVDYAASGNNIMAIENDSLNGCLCYCFYNTMSVLRDLAPGEYVITVVGGYGTPYEGATVGIDTAVIAP